MRVRAVLLAAALVLAPLGARAADLVVWWEDEFSPGEDDAVREMMAAFERKTGKTVELAFLPQDVLPGKLQGAVDAGEPPDFEFGTTTNQLVPRWAREGRLVELSAALGPLAELIDKDALGLGHAAGRRGPGAQGLYGMPMVRYTNHVHVWRSLLERAGFTLADIPKEWGPFWAFWCDKVQPAVRKATGRDDISGSASRCRPTRATRTTGWPSSPTPYARLARALGPELGRRPEPRRRRWSRRSAVHRRLQKGCTPPQSVDLDQARQQRGLPRPDASS